MWNWWAFIKKLVNIVELVKEIYLESETSEPNVVKVVKLMKLVNLVKLMSL